LPANNGQGRRVREALPLEVIDGDTIRVMFRGEITTIRLIGIDTPETVHPSEPDECYGQHAKEFTESRVDGHVLELAFDVQRRDQYGRTLAYVAVDGWFLNLLLVRRGFATVATYPPNVHFADAFLAAQRVARENGAGLWGACKESDDNGDDDNCQGYVPCIKPGPDVDCRGGEGDGPRYSGPVRSYGDDPYELDDDHDTYGCEAS
jgi:endonuclease YncB( thermonuclease family)